MMKRTLVLGWLTAINAQSSWINELHYDNASTDQGEFIEVASPVGTDISSWSLHLYNRRNPYDAVNLNTCTSSNTAAGIVLTVCDFPTNGLQNGARDGIALVDGGNQVIEFISYEGARKASSGPANGLTPIDIGVAESSSTPVGFSLQKSGTGCDGSDFTWQAPAAETKGTANNGQSFTCGGGPGATPSPSLAPTVSPTALPTVSPTFTPTSVPTAVPTKVPTPAGTPPVATAWINEFHYDNANTDQGEFVEIAYTSSVTAISSYTIVLYNGNGGTSYSTQAVPVGTAAGSINLSVIDYPSNGIQNGAPDGIALIDDVGSVVEFISYEGSLTATNGPASGLTSTNIGVSETSSTPVGFSLQRSGSGCSGSDFSWLSPSTSTKGSINSGQLLSCGPAPPTPPPTMVPTALPTVTKAPTVPVSNTGVKVLTYNILAGGTADNNWKTVIQAENPDIVVFTETGNWDDNNDLLLKENVAYFNNFFIGEMPYVGSTVQGIGFANSANAIMSRFPIVQTVQLTDNELTTDSAHDLMVWKLDVGGGKLVWVIGIHLKCCGGATNDSRRDNTMEALLNWIDINTAAADGVMLMGDFNSVSPVDTDPSFPGYQSGFEPSPGSSLNDGPTRMLLDSTDPRGSTIHTFKDAFREANPSCVNGSCCADTLCDGGLSTGCPERGYSYVSSSSDFDSRIDFIIVNQHVQVTGPATVGDLTGSNVCVASDHLPVDAVVSF